MADEDKSENSLELDKVDLSALGAVSGLKTKVPKGERPSATNHRESVSPKKLIALISATVAISLLGIAAVAWRLDLLSIGSSKENKTESSATLQVPVGPLRATLGEAGSVRISLVFICRSTEDAENLRKKTAKLRSLVLIFLNKPGIDKLILAGRYQQLRSYLISETNASLDGDYVQEIYFIDILRY